MSAHLRVSLSSLLLELANCNAIAPVPSGDAGKGADDVPMSRENAAVVDIVGAEEYVDVVGSSSPVLVNAGLESKGFTFREAVSRSSLRSVQVSGGVLDTSGLPLCTLLSHLRSSSVFLYKLKYWPLCLSQ